MSAEVLRYHISYNVLPSGSKAYRLDSGAARIVAAKSASSKSTLRTERHSVIDLHVIADDAGFADDRSGAVIDEEV